MKRIFVLSPIALVLVTILAVLFNNKKVIDSKKVVKDRSEIAVAVVIEHVRSLSTREEIQSPATLIASERATIATGASGRIASLSLELGRHVTKGQVLGRLDVRETEMKLQATQLEIERLNKEFERNKVLSEGNAINTKTLQDSRFDLDNKVIEAEQLKKQIADGNIVAPINGIITEKSKESGEYVSIGEVIGQIVNISDLKARVFLPENKVFKIRKGQKAHMTSDVFANTTFDATVDFISPQGDENHNYLVELKISDNSDFQLRAGMYALIKFNGSESTSVLQIPKSALVEGVKTPFVFVAENNKALERKIVVGREFGENIEVISGLTEGERVIVSGQINLVNGSNITFGEIK